MPPDETRYPPRIVCAALDIPHGTLSTWAKRGLLANFSVAFAQRGKARLFNAEDVLALALIKAASDYQVLPVELSSFASAAADQFMRHPDHIREVSIRYYQGSDLKVSIRYNDDVMTDPPEEGAVVTITFDVRAIFTKAIASLKARMEMRPHMVTAETRIEEVDPLLGEISRTWTP